MSVAAHQRFATKTGLALTVCRFPPGTSKWNKIEHLLFSHIAMTWRGKPIVDLAATLSLIASVRTRTGPRVRSELDRRSHPAGATVAEAALRPPRSGRQRCAEPGPVFRGDRQHAEPDAAWHRMIEVPLSALFSDAAALVLVAAGVFARVGAAVFLVPGLGERSIPMRVRLGCALAITLLLVPLISAFAPAAPKTPADLALLLVAEAASGLVIGLAFRFLVFAMQTAGMIAAQHLSVAQIFGAGVAPEPEPTIATLLAMGGIALALSAGLHVHLVASLAGLYDVLPFGRFPLGADLAEWTTARVAEMFMLGIALAAPFVAVGFAYNLALGALNRAMPQLLVALVGVPALVWIGMVVLALVLPVLMTTWLETMERVFDDPLGGIR